MLEHINCLYIHLLIQNIYINDENEGTMNVWISVYYMDIELSGH